ncbi:MAG TPA: 5-oxoprolinase subunit PxpB [Chthoniobacterales bacterium]|jgi:inhibitor of KinA
MQITPLGDSALILRVRDEFETAPEETLDAVLDTERRLATARLPGVIELAPAYTTVALFYDPARAIEAGAPRENVFDWYEQKIRAALASVAGVDDRGGTRHSTACTLDVPVCYEDEFAPDLADVAQHTGLSPQQIVDLHCGTQYRVHCVGFTAAFPFLGGLPANLATPRRVTPRKEIAAGSVGIGGAQTGIYPVKSPGGWNIIGRTPLRLFDPRKNPPSLLRAGDAVRFRSITHAEFERLTHDARSTVLSS